MRKKIIAITVLLAMAISLCAGTAMAADTKITVNDIIDNVVDTVKDFLIENDITVGSVARGIKGLLNYKDTRHVISPLKDGKGRRYPVGRIRIRN